MRNKRHSIIACGLAALTVLLSGAALAASNDEIQVYDDAINKPGEWGLDTHMNYVASGVTAPSWPGDAPSNHSFRVTPEFSYGLDGKWELGAYLPMLRTADGNQYIEGAKVRIKYMAPSDGGAFYWGMNEELGWVSLRSAEQHWNMEIRPILGYKTGNWNLTVNPIIELEFSGPNREIPDFSPAVRAAYALREGLSVGVEHYAGLGKLEHISPYNQQSQNTYLVVDVESGAYALDFGIGHGWNGSSDKLTIKAILGIRF